MYGRHWPAWKAPVGSAENILTHPSGRTEAVPIVTICFLGYALDDLSDEAVLDVCPRVTERRTC